MPLLLRNIFSVLLLQPANFVEPTPRTMRTWVVASVALSTFVCLQFPPERLALAVAPIALSMVDWPWSRRWGSAGLGRPVFTIAWCLPVMVATSALAENLLIDLLAAGYLFFAVSMQSRWSKRSEPIGGKEREELVLARAALAASGTSFTALTSHGAVALAKLGPVIARWQDHDIHEWVVDAQGRIWHFQVTTSERSALRSLAETQMLMTPGLIYELAWVDAPEA